MRKECKPVLSQSLPLPLPLLFLFLFLPSIAVVILLFWLQELASVAPYLFLPYRSVMEQLRSSEGGTMVELREGPSMAPLEVLKASQV